MNAVILTQEQYNEIITRIDEIKSEIKGNSKSNENDFVDNVDFIKLMNISKRTAQAWRDEGKISILSNRWQNLLQNVRCTRNA
jgi:hypothetical protein